MKLFERLAALFLEDEICSRRFRQRITRLHYIGSRWRASDHRTGIEDEKSQQLRGSETPDKAEASALVHSHQDGRNGVSPIHSDQTACSISPARGQLAKRDTPEAKKTGSPRTRALSPSMSMTRCRSRLAPRRARARVLAPAPPRARRCRSGRARWVGTGSAWPAPALNINVPKACVASEQGPRTEALRSWRNKGTASPHHLRPINASGAMPLPVRHPDLNRQSRHRFADIPRVDSCP